MADCSISIGRETRRFLLHLARRSIAAVAHAQPLPECHPEQAPLGCRIPCSCFVTILSDGELRGCTGSTHGTHPLYREVMTNAVKAAFHDPRFAPVVPEELDNLALEISVLTAPKRLGAMSPADLRNSIEAGTHGVTLECGSRRAVYLPQVWSHFEESRDPHVAFLTSLSRKAGDRTGRLWTDANTRFETFEATTFGETELAGDGG